MRCIISGKLDTLFRHTSGAGETETLLAVVQQALGAFYAILLPLPVKMESNLTGLGG